MPSTCEELLQEVEVALETFMEYVVMMDRLRQPIVKPAVDEMLGETYRTLKERPNTT